MPDGRCLQAWSVNEMCCCLDVVDILYVIVVTFVTNVFFMIQRCLRKFYDVVKQWPC